MTHTPTPWERARKGRQIRSVDQYEGKEVIATCEWSHHNEDWPTQEEAFANCDHIVKCVNGHDALVGAMKEIAKQLRFCLTHGGDDLTNRLINTCEIAEHWASEYKVKSA